VNSIRKVLNIIECVLTSCYVSSVILATGIARSVSPGQNVRTNAFPATYVGQQIAGSPRDPGWTPEQVGTTPTQVQVLQLLYK